MFWVAFANDKQNTATTNEFALRTHLLYRSFDFHTILKTIYRLSVVKPADNPAFTAIGVKQNFHGIANDYLDSVQTHFAR